MSRELADAIAGSELVVFMRSAHSPFVEEAATFEAVVAEFLERSN